MIQRVQSIWLFFASLCLVVMLFLPLVTKEANSVESSIYTSGLFQKSAGQSGSGIKAEAFLPLLITNIALIVICLVNIFNFRRRNVQKRLAIVSIVLTIGFGFWCSVYAKRLPGGVDGASFEFGAYLPALAILFCILAIFGINKDERLIRSAERLR
ncbi:DUF4293 domain-containing protein [Pedobacter rhizosphaerae]|uniref:DUF4293 family protein n=1 Tax=Pedobacter rhizosphaerae TaxID=390241 RepID=A0A1H9NX15_9SPHI|nr:DUF4293 domain-containing protein [Pedobacter rhizosphaerae]SER40337.1 protein of unknown function [Pedobacter rhizosphaerae]